MVECLPRTSPISSLFLHKQLTGSRRSQRVTNMTKFSKKIFMAVFSVLAGFIFITFSSSFFFLGDFLSPQDTLEKSDVIIVVSGGETLERTSEGIKLFKEGYAPFILFSGAARSGDVSNAKSMKNQALKQGVPKDKIFIEEEATSTYENATFSKEILVKNNFKKFILVTSPYHQKRAFMTFSYVYGKDYKILNHSSKDSNWEKKAWWKNKKSINTTLDEFSRVIYLLITKNYDIKND